MPQNQPALGIVLKVSKFILAASLTVPAVLSAQTNLTIYSNSLASGWVNESASSTLNFANTSPVYSSSTDSISVTINSAYGDIVLYHAPFTNTSYASISFWLNGGASGGQNLQMYGLLGTGPTVQSARIPLGTPATNAWVQYAVPLSALGVGNVTNFSGFAIQDSAGSSEPTFYLDDIQLVNSTLPVSVTVNASESVRTADARWFSLNATIWDDDLDTAGTIKMLTNMGTRALRFPGGSDADDFHWVQNKEDNEDSAWTTSTASFIQVITNIDGETMITMNYGTGSSNEAAAWVAYCNAATNSTVALGTDQHGTNWQTAGYWASLRAAAPLGTDDGKNFLRISQAAPLGFKYWEIGNEEYGSWETDSNNVAHDPYTYAVRSQGYISLIKAVDPTVKIGVVAVTGENNYANNHNHLVTNPVTGQTHYGWTPVMLTYLKSLGATPDFLIFHNYPQNAGSETDAGLLGTSTGWAYYAENLRMMITDYMGAGIGTNIELVCTENNSVSSNPGKQSASLVNGLYKLDSLAQLMQTEFNGLFWWALRNGADASGNMSTNLYGWRLYGDFGVVSNLYGTRYPTFYTSELMTNFAQTGDTVIAATSGYASLSTYAVQRQNGSLTVLAINKDPTNTLTGQISVAGFHPASSAVAYSYGIPQDNAAKVTENDSAGPAQTTLSITGTNISYAFPPYSATVLVLSPSTLAASAGGPEAICTGGSITIGGSPTANGGAGSYTYSWSPATGLSSATVANPTASPTATTTYTVTVTDSWEATAQSSVTVTVNPLPTVSVNSATVCADSSAILNAITSASSPGYLWSPGGATTASITVSPASTTTYTVTVTDGTTGCASSSSGTVTVNPVPTVSVNSATVCAGSSATLTATSSASNPSYLWSDSETTASITVSPALTTTYTVTVTDGTTGCANSGSGIVTVNPLPTITLGASPVLVYYGSSNAILLYTATSGNPDGYSIFYGSTAQAAGFSNVALTALPASPIILTVPIAAGTNVYNGTLTVNYSSTGCTSTNYAFTVTVTPLPVTLTGARLYDGTDIADTSILSIVTNYDGTNLTLSGSATLAGADAGVQNITDFSGLALGGTAATNYTLTNASGSVTVDQLPLILTGTRPYDGTATAAFGILSVVDAVGGDDVYLASGSAILAGAIVGPEAITLPGSLTLGGLTAGDYTLTGVSGIVTITSTNTPLLITTASLDSTGTNFVVCWQSVFGTVYNVLTNASLAAPQSWQVSGGPITATNTTTCFTLPGGISGNTSVYVVIQQQ
ncbi:MAG: YDG domain-containing protein [Limisphaerales bacterium]